MHVARVKIGHSGLLPVPDYKTLLVWLFHMVVRWYVICQEIAWGGEILRTQGAGIPSGARYAHLKGMRWCVVCQ
jgi:hypothetical protein